MPPTLLIYGANGYTGELISRLAVARGLRPVLAGRNAERVRGLAAELSLPFRVFGLDEDAAIDAGLADVAVVLHCAGPFSETAAPMVASCLRRGVHYLDITGEIVVFEALARLDTAARAAGVMLLPGAGFDVVPTDCLAAHLHGRLPSATHLVLAVLSLGGISRGTLTTLLHNADRLGMVRRDGRIVSVPAGAKTRAFDFGRGPVTCVNVQWGDVATAFHSTGIPNIEVYFALPAGVRNLARASHYVRPILAAAPVQRLARALVHAGVSGPDAATREHGLAVIHGEVWDDAGWQAGARLRTPEGYQLTTQTALALAERVLAGQAVPGFQTPSRLCGPDFILEFAGVARVDVG
jgi:short subunit dehydrogenase-like uncharacterized protein